MPPRRWLLAVIGAAAPLGCSSSGGSPEPVAPEERTDADDVRIDLGPSGMAATIVAPRQARARATADGVELRGGPDFHLYVRRGALQPLEEKASIVREYGSDFNRFLRDRGSEVVYETSSLEGARFHFFFTNTNHEIDYHCRTPDEGVTSLLAVEHMLEACKEVRFTDDIEPKAPEPGADGEGKEGP